MKSSPLVSVIIACYNAERYINICLNSIVNQTYKNIEIIICDDASNDNSYSILEEWKLKDNRIKVIKNDKNCFSAASRNKCIELSHGDYLLIQDIDDFSKIDRIEILLNVIQKYPNISIISSGVVPFDDNPPENVVNIEPTKFFFPSKYDFLKGMPFSHPASMIKRNCILAVKGYRVAPETRRCQDYDMFMRMYAKGYKAMKISTPLYFYRLDSANYRRRTFKARLGEYKIRVKCFKELNMMPWAYPFALKPFFAHIIQFFKTLNKRLINSILFHNL